MRMYTTVVHKSPIKKLRQMLILGKTPIIMSSKFYSYTVYHVCFWSLPETEDCDNQDYFFCYFVNDGNGDYFFSFLFNTLPRNTERKQVVVKSLEC